MLWVSFKCYQEVLLCWSGLGQPRHLCSLALNSKKQNGSNYVASTRQKSNNGPEYVFYGNYCYNLWNHLTFYVMLLLCSQLSKYPLRLQKALWKERLMFDLFKPNIPPLRSNLFSTNCCTNKRILLEKIWKTKKTKFIIGTVSAPV